MLLNYGTEADTWESLRLQGGQISQSERKSTWILIGKTDAEAEAPIFWPPDMKSQLIWKDSEAGKDWGQKEKGAAEDEVVR